MGFHSAVLPCIEVMRADGQACLGFAPKLSSMSDLRHLK
jgi:hypothetical protein